MTFDDIYTPPNKPVTLRSWASVLEKIAAISVEEGKYVRFRSLEAFLIPEDNPGHPRTHLIP